MLALALAVLAPPVVFCQPDTAVPPNQTALDVSVVDGTRAPLAGALVFAGGQAVSQREASTDERGVTAMAVPAGATAPVMVFHDEGEARAEIDTTGGNRCSIDVVLGAEPEVRERPSDRVSLSTDPANKEVGQRLQGVGIGLIALGGSLAIGGAFSGIIGPCGSDGATGANCGTDTRTQLIAGFGVSGALVVGGGIAMIILGAKKMRTQPLVTVDPRGFTLGVSGRF